MSRRTRSGHEFSPFTLDATIVCEAVRVVELLQRQIAETDAEGDDTDNDFGSESGSDIEDVWDLPVATPSIFAAPSPLPSTSDCLPPRLPPSLPHDVPIQDRSRAPKHRPSQPKNSSKRQSKARRAQKRADAKDAFGTHLKQVALRRVQERDPPIRMAHFTLETDTEVDSSGYTVRRTGALPQRDWTVPQYKEHGYRHVRWIPELQRWEEGACIPLLDADHRMLGLLASKPRSGGGSRPWQEVEDGIPRLLESAKQGVRFPAKMCHHQRGHFPAPPSGIGYGGGEEKPVNRQLSKSVRMFMDTLLNNPLVQRVSGWVNCLFAAHNPDMYATYNDYLQTLLDRDSSLRRNFVNSVFAAFTVNVGPWTISRRHRDRANRAGGWCPVSAFGNYDPTKGGQMVLDELKLIIDFPAGTTIFIPSAIVTHSNTNINIAAGETRYSMTQYFAGGLFRWVDNGFRPVWKFFEDASDDEIAQYWVKRETRWMDSLKYFPKLPV